MEEAGQVRQLCQRMRFGALFKCGSASVQL
jgi:hypothetical protein